MTSFNSITTGMTRETPTEAQRSRPPWDTPWGTADNVKSIGPDVFSVTTPGHGGLYITGKAFRAIPKKVAETFMNGGHWAEEDCEMPIAMTILLPFMDMDELQHKFPVFMEGNEHGRKRIFEIARGICERHERYQPCLKFLA